MARIKHRKWSILEKKKKVKAPIPVLARSKIKVTFMTIIFLKNDRVITIIIRYIFKTNY